MKRFYAEAVAAPCGDGFTVLLDGRAVKTPAGHDLNAPTALLAEALAAEWGEQPDEIKPHSLPLNGLCNTAIDRIGKERQAQIEATLGYGETDLLCYRAEQPAALVDRQREAWQPLLDWAEKTYGATLRVTTGVTPIRQPKSSLDALRKPLEGLDEFGLSGVSQASAVAGSLIIALALLEGEVDAKTAHRLSQIDETFQMERWGEDDEARQRRAIALSDMETAARMLALL